MTDMLCSLFVQSLRLFRVFTNCGTVIAQTCENLPKLAGQLARLLVHLFSWPLCKINQACTMQLQISTHETLVLDTLQP